MKHFQIIAISVLGHGSVSPDHGSNHVETAQLRIWRLFKGVNWYPKCYTLLLHFPIQCYCKYPAEVVPYRNPSPGLCLRDWSLFIVLGGGGGEGVFLRQRSTYVIPPYSIQCGFDPPTLAVEDFMNPPPPSIPATTKSQCYYTQTSDIYINDTYVSWTLNNNFTHLVIWYALNCLWRVTLLIQIVENKVIVALVLLTVEFFLIFLIPWFPVTFIFGATRFVCVHRLFDVSIIMTSNSFYFVKL